MALHKLTDLAVKRAKARPAEYLLGDGGGLYLRVLPSGTKTWQMIYTHAGRARKIALGDTHALSLADARQRVQVERGRLSAGDDPRLAKSNNEAAQAAELAAQADAERADALTLRDLFDAWLRDGVARRDGNAGLQRAFDFNVGDRLAAKPLKSVTEHDLRAALRAIVDRGANRMAVQFCGQLRQMFRWAEKRQPWRRLLQESNPADLIEISKIVHADYDLHYARERVLSEHEIRELRSAFADSDSRYSSAPNRSRARQPLEKTSRIALWVCLSTTCRIGELLMTRWEHVDRSKGEWFIPKENVKGTRGKRQDQLVYLSDFALRQFNALHEITGRGDWCFPARLKKGHIAITAVSKQVGDRQVMFKKRAQPLAKRSHDDSLVLDKGRSGEWTPHDLRRTAATMMQALGVPLDVIDRCQNHVLAGSRVRRHYMHHDYAVEKRDAWGRLGAHLDAILGREASLPSAAVVVAA